MAFYMKLRLAEANTSCDLTYGLIISLLPSHLGQAEELESDNSVLFSASDVDGGLLRHTFVSELGNTAPCLTGWGWYGLLSK